MISINNFIWLNEFERKIDFNIFIKICLTRYNYIKLIIIKKIINNIMIKNKFMEKKDLFKDIQCNL